MWHGLFPYLIVIVLTLLASLAWFGYAMFNVGPEWTCRCEDSDNCTCGGAYGQRRDDS